MSIWCFLVEMCGYSEKCTRPDPWFVSRTRTRPAGYAHYYYPWARTRRVYPLPVRVDNNWGAFMSQHRD